jgi:hypothetical protein
MVNVDKEIQTLQVNVEDGEQIVALAVALAVALVRARKHVLFPLEQTADARLFEAALLREREMQRIEDILHCQIPECVRKINRW